MQLHTICNSTFYYQKYKTRQHKLPKGSITKIFHDYKQHFSDTPELKSTYTVFPITKILSKTWSPQRKSFSLHFHQVGGKELGQYIKQNNHYNQLG